MPIDDERRFLSGIEVKRFGGPERPSSPKNTAQDPVREKLQELRKVLEASKEDREEAQIKSKEREKIGKDAERARQERSNRYEKLQQRYYRVKEFEDDGRRADAELQIQEAESYRLVEEELERYHQDRLETRAVFQAFLREREQQRNEIISTLRERSK